MEKKPPEKSKTVPLDQLLTTKEVFQHYLRDFSLIREAYGIRIEKGVWVLFDSGPGKRLFEPMKSWLKEVLEEKKKEGKLQVLKTASQTEKEPL